MKSDLLTGRPIPAMLRFTVPIFIGNLFNMAYNLADTRIIGSFLGNDALAAVGSVSTFSELVLGFIIGLANGFAVITAQTYGSGRKDRIKHTFSNALFLGLAASVIITAVTLLGLTPIMNLLNVMPEHQAMAASYIRIIFAGLAFAAFYNTMAANLRAIGDALTPLIFLIVSVCLNVGLDILMVGFLRQGVAGAAAATIFSQLIAAGLCFLYAWRKYEYLRFRLRDFRPDGSEIGRMLPGGISMGLMSCLVSAGTVSLQTAINTLGTNTIVAHSATRKLTSLFMMVHSSLGTTLATYVGQNYGAGRMDRIRKGIASTIAICYGWCICVVIIAYTICGSLIVAITDTQIAEVVEIACSYQRVHTLFYFICCPISLLRNSLQGMGDHKTPIVSSSLELVAKMVFAFALTPMLGYAAIIWSEPVAWIIMIIPLIWSIWRRIW